MKKGGDARRRHYGGKPVLSVTVSSGENHTIAEWSERTGVSIKTIYRRLSIGVPPDEAVGLMPLTTKWDLKKEMIEAGGTLQSIEEWASHAGVPEKTIRSRRKRGWSDAQAVGLEPPPSLIEWGGKHYQLKELAQMYGMSRQTLSLRLIKGWSLHEALITPVSDPKASIFTAKARGTIGRKQKIVGELLERAREMRATGASYGKIAKTLNVSRGTIVNHRDKIDPPVKE
jgi:DNA-binding CsgD family transcriptional regulator